MITFPPSRATIGIMEEISSFVDPIIVHSARIPCVGEIIEGYSSRPKLVTRVVHHVWREDADGDAEVNEIEIDATVWVISEEQRALSTYLNPQQFE